MADRFVLDLGADGVITAGIVSADGGLPEKESRAPFAWPLGADALEDLRWYLEDYLQSPFGVWEDRGPVIAGCLAGWGDLVFTSLLGSGPARDAYQRARDKGLEVVFRSAVPGLLGLPWELMRDEAGPVALGMGGISRSLPTAGEAETLEVPGGRLRVLMVISRPAGIRDVGYQMVARPLLERLAALRGEVDLTVLRPPTFDALRQAVTRAADAGEPFHVMHFDGHGVMPGHGEGVLAFEQHGGGSDHVRASKVAAVLAEGRVPVVVLNACQSGAVGKELEASVATALLMAGCAAVVAMAYRVYAVAAAEFMAAFYESLFSGASVGQAVTAGRRRLYAHEGRPSPKGEMPLADWLVPVHYLRKDVSFPHARTSRPASALPLDSALDQIRAAPHGPAQDQLRELDVRESGSALDSIGLFTGRDALFFELEVAARLSRVVILHGPGGTGKTELAKAFGRWWRDTGGIDQPGWIFWHSFEPGIPSFGLNGVVTEIGLTLFGTDFARMGQVERRSVLMEALEQRRMLLIWDNFETVRSMPDPAASAEPLDDVGYRELREFLGYVARRGRSVVLVTSRTQEGWLGDFRRVEVGGLAPHEAAAYAGSLLAPFSAANSRRNTRAFGELLAWLDGHPLSMRLILPSLNRAEPEVLLAGLRGIVPLPDDDDGTIEGRTTSLAACVAYSFSHLAVNTRRLLPAICLFHGVVDTLMLGRFSEEHDAPARFRDADVHKWLDALEDAARVGLLTRQGRGMYRIHPALPSYLAARWRREDRGDHDAARDAATCSLLTAHSVYCIWLDEQISSGDAARAYVILDLQRRTFGSLLGYALDRGLWEKAQDIVQTLTAYWKARGLDEEADEWSDLITHATEGADGEPPDLGSTAGDLWLFSAGFRAGRQLSRLHLDAAETTYQQMLAMFQAQPPSPNQQDLGLVYHQLGAVAYRRGQLDEAEDWYRRSLVIYEDLGDQPHIAMICHELGMAAEGKGLLSEAEDWSRKSLALYKGLGDKPRMAASYDQHGWVAQRRGLLDAAEDWYRRSLAIHENIGDRAGIAGTCHQLGTVAYLRWRLVDAEDWHRRSLAIYEDLGDQPHIAISFHHLGAVAQAQQRLDDAEDWYRRSLAILEDLGDRPHMAGAYHQLGLVALLRLRLDEAEGWFHRSLAIFEELVDRPHVARNYLQLGSAEYLRGRPESAEDWYRRSQVIYEDLGDAPGMADIYHQLGMAAQARLRVDDAEDWYRRSMAIRETLGDRPGMAPTFWQLSLLTENRGQPRIALTWMVRHLALCIKYALFPNGEWPERVTRFSALLGIAALEDCWNDTTGSPLPQAIRNYASPSRPRRVNKGKENHND